MLGGGFNAAAAELFAAFAAPVRYEPAVGAVIDPLPAVFAQDSAPSFEGPGATLRTTSWRVRIAAVAAPAKGDVLVASGVRWMVIDITRHDDVGEWSLVVEVTT